MAKSDPRNRHIKAVVIVDLGEKAEIVRCGDRSRLTATLYASRKPFPLQTFTLRTPLTYEGGRAYLDFDNASPRKYLNGNRINVLSQLNKMQDFYEFVDDYCNGKLYPPRERVFTLDISSAQRELERARNNRSPGSSLRKVRR